MYGSQFDDVLVYHLLHHINVLTIVNKTCFQNSGVNQNYSWGIQTCLVRVIVVLIDLHIINLFTYYQDQ